jgi:hypothetical protein
MGILSLLSKTGSNQCFLTCNQLKFQVACPGYASRSPGRADTVQNPDGVAAEERAVVKSMNSGLYGPLGVPATPLGPGIPVRCCPRSNSQKIVLDKSGILYFSGSSWSITPRTSLVSSLFPSSIGGAAWQVPIVRASKEGSLRPRVARAQGIVRQALIFFLLPFLHFPQY